MSGRGAGSDGERRGWYRSVDLYETASNRRFCVAGDNEGENEARSIGHEARHAPEGRPRIAYGFSVLGQTFPIRCWRRNRAGW